MGLSVNPSHSHKLCLLLLLGKKSQLMLQMVSNITPVLSKVSEGWVSKSYMINPDSLIINDKNTCFQKTKRWTLLTLFYNELRCHCEVAVSFL